ncbi:MAG TPA: 3-oxoadipate enol-lactonase [Candidatus Methylomirabilis sp.]|nr:3-oxoadipate enol-lactonase [Candidatus Methylomirabilis sp.]
MPFAQLQAARIHYDLSGPADAPVLVFSNSLGANFSMWDSQLPALQKHFRVLRSDTRGHGQSSVTPGPYSIEQLSKDVLSLLDSLHLDRVYFCGLSMGGMIGMWLSVNAAHRLHKVVLCNTAAKIGTPEFWNPRIEKVRKGGMRAVSVAIIERWFTPAYRAQSPSVIAATQSILESHDPEGYVANCAAIRDFDARATISAIHLPTLIITGTHDPATTVADGRYLEAQIKGARFAELNASHLSNIEACAHFNAEISSFLLS